MNLNKVFQNRNLTLLWAGQVVSQSGDSIFQIGLLWLALELSGSEAVTGLVAMSSYLPAVALSLFAGVIADRFNRKRIMLTADAARTLFVWLIPIAYFFGILNPVLLAATAFLIAIAATFFNPSRDSIIPHIVPREGLVRANSLIQTSWQFALLLGPAIAGVLIKIVGKIHLFSADSLFYLVSFICILFIRPQRRIPPAQEDKVGFKDVKEGLLYALKQPVIFPLLLITIADNILIMGPAIVGTPVFVRQVLKMGAEAFAAIHICYAIGMLLGTAGIMIWGGRIKKGKLLLIGMILDGFTFIPLYFAHTFSATAIIIIVHASAIPMLTISRASLIQDIVPSEMTGRIFALVNMAVVGMSAVSSGFTGFALEAIGAPTVFLLIGFGGGLCGIVGWIFAKELRNKD